MNFNIFGQPSENKGTGRAPETPPPIKIPDTIPMIPGSESKIHQCVIKRIMTETLEENSSTVKKIRATKEPLRNEAMIASFELLLSTNEVYDEIVQAGGFTEENLEQIAKLREEIENLKIILSKTGNTEEEKIQSFLDIALSAFTELDSLYKAMEETAPFEEKFLDSLEAIESGTFSQNYSGELLLLPDQFLKGSEALSQLWMKMHQYGEGTLARQSAEEMVDHGAKSLAFALSEWRDNALESIRQQRDLLLKAERSGNDEEKIICKRLLFSLQAQLTDNQNKFAQMNKILSGLSYLEAVSDEVSQLRGEIDKELAELNTIISKIQIPIAGKIPPYGKREWQTLARARFPMLAAKKDEAGWSIFHPEHWSARTKQIVHSLLIGMQLSHQVISTAQQIEQRAGSAEKSVEGVSTAVGWFHSAFGMVKDVAKSLFFPEQYKKEQEASKLQQIELERAQLKSAAFRQAEEQIGATQTEISKAIHQAKVNRNPDLLSALLKIDRELEIILRSKPGVTASDNSLVRWKNEVDEISDRAAERLSKIKPVSGETKQGITPASEVEARGLLSLQTFIESPSLLPQRADVDPDKQLTDRVFQHILGDFFGKDTGLEGYSSFEMLKYVLSLVSAKATSLKMNPLCQKDDLRDFCSEIFDVNKEDVSLEMFTKLEQQLTDAVDIQRIFEGENSAWFVDAFKLRIDHLQPGESFFFLGGWQHKTAGHAVVYEVVRQADGLLTFRIFNRGEGANRYSQAIFDGKIQMMSFGEIVDISEESLSNPLFSHALREINVKPERNEKDWSDYEFYTTILPLLDGKISSRVYTTDELMRWLKVGHCTYLSLAALMNFQLGDKLTYTHWEIEMQFKTLWDYFVQNQPILTTEEQPRRLLKEGLVQFGRNLANARSNHIVSDAEVAWIGDKLKTLETELISAESQSLKQVIMESPVVNLRPIDRPISTATSRVNVDKPHVTKSKYIPTIWKYLDRTDWKYRPETFINDLRVLVEEVREFRSLEITSAKVAIETFLNRVPISGDVFWKDISSVEASQSLDMLSELARSYFFINGLSRSKEWIRHMLFAQDNLAMIKILTLADALSKDFKEKWGFEFPDLFQTSMEGVLDSKSTSTSISDPSWEDERRLMRDYWLKAFPPEQRINGYSSLFGYENGFVNEGKDVKHRFHHFSDIPESEKYEEERLHWGDIEFAKMWLKRPEIANKLPDDFNQKGDVLQALLLLSEGYDQFPFSLPSQFFALKEISRAIYYSYCKLDVDYYSALVFQEDPERRKIESMDNVLFTPESIYYLSNVDTVIVTYHDKKHVVKEYFINKGQEWVMVEPFNLMEVTQGKNLHSPFLESLVFFSMQNTRNAISPAYLVVRYRIPPHERMNIIHEMQEGGSSKISVQRSPRDIVANIPFFEMQEFLSLSSVKSLQIQETFSFFSLNPQFLSERRYQEMFSYLMTENGLFIDELLKDPEQAFHFVLKLAEFCKEQARINKERDDIGSMLFFLELNRKFSSLVDFTKEKYPNAFSNLFSSPFGDVSEEIREVANNKNALKVDRQYAHYLLMMSAAEHKQLTETDVKDLLFGMIHFDVYGLPPNPVDMNGSPSELGGYGVMKNDGYWRKELGEIAELDNHRWDPTKTKQIREFLIKIHGALQHLLSDSDLRDRLFNEVVKFYEPNFTQQVWNPMPAHPYYESADGAYVLDLENGNLFISGGGLRVFPKEEREDEFVKYVLGDEQDVLVKQNQDRSLEFHDKSGNEYLYKSGLYRKFGGEWFKAEGSWKLRYRDQLLIGTFIWRGESKDIASPVDDGFDYRSGEQYGPDHILVYIHDIKTNRLKYKAIQERERESKDHYRLKEIHRLDEQEKETGEVLTNNYVSCYDFLKRITDEDDVLVWQNKDSKDPVRVELLSYDFSFSTKKHEGEWVAFSDSYPDLHLAKLQYVPQLGDITSYLVLDDDRGGKFALISEYPFRKLNYPLVTETNLNLRHKSHLFLQRIASDGSDMVPESREDRYKLASLFFWERDYERTMKYLRGYGELLSPLTRSEISVLERIISLQEMNNDQTPEAFAVRFFVYLLLNQSPSSEDITVYLSQLDQLGNLRLKPEEEKMLGIEGINRDPDNLPSISSGISIDKISFNKNRGLLKEGLWDDDIIISALNVGVLSEDDRYMPADDPYKYVRYLRKEWIDKGGKDSEYPFSIPRASVLQPDLDFVFVALYNILKNQRFDQNAIDLINNLSGIELPSDTVEGKVKEMIRQLLTLQLRVDTFGGFSFTHNQVLAVTLLAVMDDPNAFPSLGSIGRTEYGYDRNELKKFVKQEKIMAKVRERWKAPAEFPIGRHEAITREPSGLPVIQNIQIAPLTPTHLMSVQLQEGFPLQFSGAANLDKVVEWVPADPEEISKIRDAGKALSKVFDLAVSDPIAKAKYMKIQGDITESAEKRIAAAGHYRLKSLEALNTLKAELLVKASQLEPLLENQELQLLALANKPYESAALETERNARIAGRLEKRLSLTELFHLFRTRDKELIARRNPALSVDEIEPLFELIREYLETITLHQHQLRMLKLISDIEKKPGPVELQALVDEFSASAKANRQYNVVNHPEYLNLEQNGNILIRRDQVDNLEKMAISEVRQGTTSLNGAALEAIPGSGKTSVLLIEQALNAADGEHLSLVVIPEALMPSMSVDIQKTFGDAYGTFIKLIEFNRRSPSKVADLMKIDDILNDAITNRKVVLITDKSLQSFFLEYIRKSYYMKGGEIFNDFKSLSFKEKSLAFEYDEELKIMEEVLFKFTKLGIATLDEIDLILDALRSHHFTIGSPQLLKLEVGDAVSALYGLIATNSDILQAIKFPFLPNSTGPAFTEQRYRESVLPIIVGKVLDGSILSTDKEMKAFLKSLTIEQSALLETYLRAKKDPEAIAFFSGLESVRIKNILAVLKEEINVLIPLTASKNVNEHFGPMPSESGRGRSKNSDLSIPYRGSNNPVKGSEHGTDLEILNYSIDMNMALGVTENVVVKEIENLKKLAEEELTLRGVSRLEDCEGYASFIKLCGGEKRYNLFKLKEEDIREITALVNKSPETKLDLISKYVIPQVKTYPVELSSSGELYSFLLHHVKGFTGTLWNAESFPNIFYGAIESDATAKTLNILWEKSPKGIPALALPSVKGIPSEHVKQLVDEIYGRKGGFRGCFADSAGLFREVDDNSLVAREILRYQPEAIKGVVYYDQQGHLMVWKRDDKAVPLERSSLVKEEVAAYWDQQHTTGSDIKLGLTMRGTVSVGRYTMMRDLIQAVWRLRGLEKGQQVDFVVSRDDLQVIRETLKNAYGKEVGDTLGLDEMFLYSQHIQISRQGEDVYRTLKSKLNGVLIRKVMEVITEPELSHYEKAGIIYATRSLFIDEAIKEPFEVYGGIEEEIDSKTAVENEVMKVLRGDAFKAFSTLYELYKRFSAKAIEAELREVAARELAKIPPKVKQNTGYEKEVAVEVETEKETEKEKEKEKMKSKHKYGDGEIYTEPRPVVPWLREAVFSSKAYLPEAVAEIKGNSLEMIRSRGMSNVFSVNPVLADDILTKGYGDVFDENLLSTLNFMPLYIPDSSKQLVYHPFGRYHDVVSNLIVVENLKTGVFKLVIGNQEDIKALDQYLLDDLKNPIEGIREERVCLYNLENGVIRQGSDRFDLVQLEKSEEFIRLKTQAKFFAGFVTYSQEEQEVLREWFKVKGPERMMKFFGEVVLAEKETRQAQYHRSTIQRIFAELIV